MSYVLLKLREPADWADFHAIRRVELFEARGRFGVYDDNHPHDRADFAHPFLLRKDGRALGAVRLDLFGEGRAAVRLVAITAAEQGRGHGRVMEAMVTEEARPWASTRFWSTRSAVPWAFMGRRAGRLLHGTHPSLKGTLRLASK
jgi:GNAT superfamily N-acetyltransferase